MRPTIISLLPVPLLLVAAFMLVRHKLLALSISLVLAVWFGAVAWLADIGYPCTRSQGSPPLYNPTSFTKRR